jgi:Protein of unknown function (DUF3108)
VNPINAILRVLGLLVVLLMAYGLRPHFLAGIEPELAHQGSAPKATILPHVPFEVGETFVYSVSWKIFDAGIATMRLAEKTGFQNEEVYRVTATARSVGILSRAFQVLDVFESHFQVKELCSRRITKNIQEGSRRRETVLVFDPKTRQARLEEKDLNQPDLPVKRSESSIPFCVEDVISALYVIRTKTLKVGEQVNFPVNDGGKTYDVSVEVQATEEIRTPAGTFQTLRLEPRVFEGLFRKKGRMFIWLTDDAEKMPVQVKARINIGTITASLTRVSKTPVLQPSSLVPRN